MVQMESEMFEGGGDSGLSNIIPKFDLQKFPYTLIQNDFPKQDTNWEEDAFSIDFDKFFEDESTFPMQEASNPHLHADTKQIFYTSECLQPKTNLIEPSHSNSCTKLESGAGRTAQQWLSDGFSNQPQQIQLQEFDNIFPTREETFNVLANVLPSSSATHLISVDTQLQVILAFCLDYDSRSIV